MSRKLLSATAWTMLVFTLTPPALFGGDDVDKRIERLLGKRVDMTILEGSTLSDALEFIGLQHDFPVAVDWEALEERGVDRDSPVALTLSGVTLRTALSALLEPLHLAWHVGEEALVVAPGENEAEQERDVDAEQRIADKLEQETDVLILEGSTLSDAIDFVSLKHNIPILPDWEGALADIEVDRDLPVVLEVSGIELRNALKLLLEPCGLTWYIAEGVLQITSKAAAERILEIRVYDVRRFAADDMDPDQLADMIRYTIHPHTWSGPHSETSSDGKVQRYFRSKDDGRKRSGVATIVALPGILIVSQSQHAHAQIEALLEQIEDVVAEPEPRLEPTPTF